MNRDSAEILGIQALGWLAANEEYLLRFLNLTGVDASGLRARAQDPEFLGFVLDFLLGDDAVIMAFCADSGAAPETPMQARAMLPGGEMPNWT